MTYTASNGMNIGIFDSGLGGLFIARAIIKLLPQYDYIYLGDTRRAPYGGRSKDTIYKFTREAVEHLFKQNCGLIILACNTASAQALGKIQKEFLPGKYPDRRVLGVIVPTAEAATDVYGHRVSAGHSMSKHAIGVLATRRTVASGTYIKEIHKLKPHARVFQQAAPDLVPMIESGIYNCSSYDKQLHMYLRPVFICAIDSLILGCTHYHIIRPCIEKLLPPHVRIVSQEEIIPEKLRDYLKRHPEIESNLSKMNARRFFVTDLTEQFEKRTQEWFDDPIQLECVSLETT